MDQAADCAAYNLKPRRGFQLFTVIVALLASLGTASNPFDDAARSDVQSYRVGEAARPGPGHNLDDPDADMWEPELEHTQLADHSFLHLQAGGHAAAAIPSAVPPADGGPPTATVATPPGAGLQPPTAEENAHYGTNDTHPPTTDKFFIPTPTYQERLPGYEFKRGDRGLGYYKTTPITLCLEKSIPPRTRIIFPIRLADFFPDPTTNTCNTSHHTNAHRTAHTHDTTTTSTLTTNTNKTSRRKAAQTYAADDPFSPHVRSISCRDRDHIDKGHWTVDTFNANCWTRGLPYMGITAADVVLHQETRVLEGGIDGAASTARTAGWKTAFAPSSLTAKQGISAGAAVAVRSHLGLGEAAADKLPYTESTRSRIKFAHFEGLCRGGVHCGSVYCYTGLGIAAKCNLDLLEEIRAGIATIAGPWILGGDFNCTPAELTQTGWLETVGGVIHAPGVATCNDKVYDFFITSQSIAHAVKRVATVADGGCWTHSPAKLWISADVRRDKVQQLRSFGNFPALLPEGPPRKPDDEEGNWQHTEDLHPTQALEAAWEGYADTIGSIENCLAAICNMDPKQAEACSGRAEGPSTKWVTVAGNTSTHTGGKSDPISRAWRRTHGWLQAIIATKKCCISEANRWRIRNFEHDLKVDDPALEGEASFFQAWRGNISAEMLASTSTLKLLRRMASDKADALETAAATRAFKRHMAWLQDGPSKDGYRAGRHQWRR